ncbi:MAG TPA: methanogenesis marker protein Mmp4/MtxX [Methanomicrobiales archaeon]|nr:methanogenesis marker protein Mmp4/MtxX [Methanomicrobiales archaeon]
MRVGIGAGPDIQKVLAAAKGAGPGVTVTCFAGREHDRDAPDPSIRISERPGEDLVKALMDGEIDAAVRGSLPANETLRALREATGVARLLRIAILATPAGRKFLLAPVGVDEGWTVAEKVELVERGRVLAGRLGLGEEVAVLSGGRLGDLGRHPAVDRSIAEAERVAAMTGAVHREILIEEAVREAGMVLAPDGISGNLVFRTLVLVAGGNSFGAPVVNIDRIFVDSSRASPNYANALFTAIDLTKR